MYGDILTEIERSDDAVLDHRAVVGGRRRAMRAVQGLTGGRPD
ncbi:hypothetical protein [Gordonia rhizosphera]|uniref:Uncharacterized protein n=1 Tax=Gordonia rhizosphera NBRC 16068 TaxID=1108045 RepID=K6WV37_9ACTN|nr:hypothetical protein [Gordonia rhizosphera]GAB90414.1 hypothetical protein GORHZ_102_00410 [Gordonia rhizosphera NBRC 16068]